METNTQVKSLLEEMNKHSEYLTKNFNLKKYLIEMIQRDTCASAEGRVKYL